MTMNKSTCVIVGVGPGLGISLVEQFAQKGFSIAMIARNKEKLNQYKVDFAKKGFETYAYPTDASNNDALKKQIHTINDFFGSIDVLIFNASVLHEGKPSQIAPNQLETDFKINFHAAVVSAQTVIPLMKDLTTGSIIFTGSAAGLKPIPSVVSLSVSKAALRFYALALAEEWKDSNIYIGTITINGTMEKGTHFDPEKIAEKFWWMYQTKPIAREFVYD